MHNCCFLLLKKARLLLKNVNQCAVSNFWLYRFCRVMGTSYFLTRQLIVQNICAVSAFEAWLQSGQCFFYAFEETGFFSTKDLGVLCGMQKWKIKVADMI